MDLRGRSVLLTGAAGGIGAAVARELAQAGCRLVLVDVDADGLERVAGELQGAAIAVPADVSELGQLEAAVVAGRERFGPIGVVIANAAVDDIAPVAEIDPSAFDRVISVNLLGAFRTVRAALADVRAERGHVLFVNSLGSVVPPPYQAAYAASKAGIAGLADSLRLELRDSGATVGQIYFGAVDTEHFRTGMAHPLMVRATRRIPKSFMKAAPVSGAAVAVRTAIEKRTRTAVFPNSNRLMVSAPQLVRPMIERRIST
jgi:NAD(P)-dependent dehydrogenase (short-subunit alcohol dehydrogenase family)